MGFLPSLGWEVHQHSNGGIFWIISFNSWCRRTSLAVSTKEVPIDDPRHKTLITVRSSVNID